MMPRWCAAPSASRISTPILRDPPAGHRSLLDERGKGRAFHELHHDERRAVPLVDVVDGADARMIQRRGEARFAPEALQRIVIRRAAPEAGT